MSLVNLNLNFNTDRTVNRIAVCSAVIAGFAYVGYSVCCSALSTRKSRRKDDETSHSVLLRRLSQTTQTDALLGDLVFDGSQKILLRPKSVQERIKELNMQARQFASAVNALQKNNHARFKGGRSLQPTPWSSPRILSPVDVNSVSLDICAKNSQLSPFGSPSKQNSFKSSIYHKNDYLNDIPIFEDSRTKEILDLWTENRHEVFKTLPTLLSNPSNLSTETALYLIAALNCEDASLQLEVIKTLANSAAFQCNQEILGKAGLITFIPRIYVNATQTLKIALCALISNMSLNEDNSKEFYPIVSMLCREGHYATSDSPLLVSILKALINISVLPVWHTEMRTLLYKIYSLLDEGIWGDGGCSFHALRLLVNLSCNDQMIPFLLAAQAPKKLIYLLDVSTSPEVLLRVLTFLANVAECTRRLNIDPLSLPAEGKAAAPDTMYAAIFGLAMLERFKRKAQHLSERNENSELCFHARRLCGALMN